jgi:hypothetical protein
MKLRMFTSAHIDEIAFSEVLRIPIYMMRYLVPIWLGNSSMNQFPAIIPDRISFRIVMKPSHKFSPFNRELRLRAQPCMKKPDIDLIVPD